MLKHNIFTVKLSRVIKNLFIFLLVTAGFFAGGNFTLSLVGKSTPLFASSAISAASEKSFFESIFGQSAILYSVIPITRAAAPPSPTSTPHIAEEPAPLRPPKEISMTVSNAEGYKPEGGIYVTNDSGYSFDLGALLNESLSIEKESPAVLIIHTHTSEAYTPTENYMYQESDPYRTENPEFNITLTGEKIAETLTARGIGVIHDTTSHDYPSYSGSYRRAMETIEKHLAENPSIRFVLDIHRDAIPDTDGSYLKTTAEVHGKKCAQVMVVVGTDRGGLEHPDWIKNLQAGLKLQRAIVNKYPGLARPLHLREERFNGHTSHGALLIEVGSNSNTMDEALISAKLLGECIADMIDSETY